MNFQKLLSLRSGHRSVISRQLEKIEQAKNDSDLTEFHAVLEAIQNKAAVIESLNEKILSLTDVNDIEEELISSEEYSLDLTIKLKHLLKFGSTDSNQTNESAAQGQSNTQNDRCTHNGENTQGNTNTNQHDANYAPSFLHASNIASSTSQFYRLPKLSIPTFNGDILKWQTFWDSFESTVHTNINLTDVQKFNYLHAQLEGDAARTIDGFPLTNANYIKAVELLRQRFGQTHKITHAYMQALLQLTPPTINIQSLRNFYDRMEAYIRGLETLGQCQDSYGSLLVPVIIGKLPADIRRQLARERSDGNWLIQDLRAAIFREINILEAGSSSEYPSTGMYQTTASFLTTGTTGNFNANYRDRRSNTGQNSQNRTYKKCAFCEEQHFSNDCAKVTDYSSRLEIVKKKKLCYNCLGNHQVSKCKSTKRCRICKRKHHSSICNTPGSAAETQTQNPVPNTTQNPVCNTNVSAVVQQAEFVLDSDFAQQPTHVLLKTAVAPISSRTHCADANILFDEGSQRSFITEKLAKTLQLTVDGTDVVKLATFGNTATNVKHLNTATVYVHTDHGDKIPIKVLIVPMIATPLSNVYQKSAATLSYLRGLRLAHPAVSNGNSFDLLLLIGADFYWSFIQDNIIRGEGPTAVQSKLGYLLSGPIPVSDTVTPRANVQTIITMHIQSDLEFNLENFWSLESLGITNPADEPDTTELTQYQQYGITFNDGSYIAKLPWKHDHPTLPSNYNVTKRRTENMIRRLRQQPEMLKKYDDIIKEQEKRGFIEKVDDTDGPRHAVHYIPHHPVKKESSTTPIRIVYDCSCRENKDSPSLNDCLESIPPLLNSLTSILVRFRYHGYAVSTDIEKAFLHVGLDKTDRDVTRFLWLTDPSTTDNQMTTYRFRSVLFGATCSPFILNATILQHLSINEDIPVTQILKRDLYVDNILSSLHTEEEILHFFRESRALMSKAGFNLRSWTSNSTRLKDLAKSEGVHDPDSNAKILGLRWNPENDILSFPKYNYKIPEDVTKRFILQESSKIFDPLGLLSPVTVRAKLLIQDLWKERYQWDTPLPDSVKQKWESIASDLTSATNETFPRYYFSTADDREILSDENTLHVFVDASMRSYGTTTYLCRRNNASLIMAKNRVAPIKKISLARLELMAAVLGARLAKHVQSSIPVTTTYFWTDSQIVLYWLKGTQPLKRFVEARRQEIRDLTDPNRWNYCPTNENPADLLTRGLSSAKFKDNRLWWNGPSWLNDRTRWP